MANNPRKAYVNVKFMRAKKNGSKSHSVSVMAKYTGGFSFTEAATDEIDSISLNLVAKGSKWISGWMPKKGDKLEATIITKNWDKNGKQKKLYCGKFCLDDISISGPELSCEIRATSVPELGAIRCTKRTRTWKRAKFDEIVKKIAKRYHLKIKRKKRILCQNNAGRYWSSVAGTTMYSHHSTIKQSKEDDLSFLTGLCQKYGMGIKVANGTLVLYNKTWHEKKIPSATIRRRDMLDWSYNSMLSGTYTGVKFRYKIEGTKKTRTTIIGGKSRLLVIDGSSKYEEAVMTANEELNAENEKAVTMSVTLPGNTKIRAGNVVQVSGLSKLNGRYFVDKATHSIDSDSGYTTILELHKCSMRLENGTASNKKGGSSGPNKDELNSTASSNPNPNEGELI